MFRFSGATIFLIASLVSLAGAQDVVPKVQAFGGYSWMHTGTGGLNGPTLGIDLRQNPDTLGVSPNFNGWNAEGQYNFDRWIGAVVDATGEYGTPISASAKGVSGLPSMTQYSVLAGPVVSYRGVPKLTPFVHALFGWDRAHLRAGAIEGTTSPAISFASTYTSFAMVFGGGVDYTLSRRVSLRLGQVDYFRTTLDLNSLYGSAFGSGAFHGLPTRENNIRFSTGFVFRF